jgi:hypothetical protein
MLLHENSIEIILSSAQYEDGWLVGDDFICQQDSVK